jgi:hypothetical protein
MEKKLFVAMAAALMSSTSLLHSDPVRADDLQSAYDDATVDASLDRGEERVTADADSRTRLKDLRYAYFIGYNARAREDSKPYATLGDEVGHPSKQVSTQVMPVPQKQVPAHFTPPKRVAAPVTPPKRGYVQATPFKQVSAPVMPLKRVSVRVTPPKQISVPVMPLKQVSAPVAPPKRVAVPVTPLKQASVQVAPLKQVSAPVMPLKRVSARVTPPKQVSAQVPLPKQVSAEATPPKPVSEQVMAPLPEGSPGHDDAQVAEIQTPQVAQRARPVEPQQPAVHEEPPYIPAQPVQHRQPQQYAAAPAYGQMPAESQEPDYPGQAYAPPPPRPAQATQYAPAQYPPAQYPPVYAQSTYVPRPPAQATAQPVIMVVRPPAYPAYDQRYTPPEYRRPYPAGYGNPAPPPGYQGWE